MPQTRSVESIVRRLSTLADTDATRDLTKFYVKARFRVDKDAFNDCYCDGSNDGGIDYCYREDNSFYIFQTKFSKEATAASDREILAELRKIENTLKNQNPNRKAEPFVNDLRLALQDPYSTLEVVWLTSKLVPETVSSSAQDELNRMRRDGEWKIKTDFVPVDKNTLRSVLQDIEHGNIPYTGKYALSIANGQCVENYDESTEVYSVIASVDAVQILKWFGRLGVDRFLQKNVRGFLGENDVNRGMVKSFFDEPSWFWYKHNGIIVFADSVRVDRESDELVLRNPQIVNGGQTARALFSAWDRRGRHENAAKVLVRAYRLPYESAEAYERGIAIISALNSQSKIYVSDLRSSDPRQVRLEELVKDLDYTYYRKRAKDNKASRYNIAMRQLALLHYVVKKKAPNIGVVGPVEDLFKDQARYDEIFNEREVNCEMSLNHVVLRYIAEWAVDQYLRKIRNELPKRDEEYWAYTRFFVLVDFCNQLEEWKQSNFNAGYKEWKDFLDSEDLRDAVRKYSKRAFRDAREMIPKREEARSYLRTPSANEKYSKRVSTRFFRQLVDKAHSGFEGFHF